METKWKIKWEKNGNIKNETMDLQNLRENEKMNI